MGTSKGRGTAAGAPPGEVPVDPYRAFVFPNRVREQRRARGFAKLLRLATKLPEIPYIRLSKIERGEVVPRPDELRGIAAALGLPAEALLLDIDAAGFDMASWAEPFVDTTPSDLDEARFAVLLAAAVRARRSDDSTLTIASIERAYGIPPVNLSRIENAQKPFARWNTATRHALLQLFDLPDETELRGHIAALHASGALGAFLGQVVSPTARQARTSAKIAEVAAALSAQPAAEIAAPPSPASPSATSVRLMQVLGAPLPHGLIADTPTAEKAEAPRAAGPRAFALQICRATLGAGLPSQSVVIADPDRAPTAGGIAVLREEAGWRLLSVGSDRDGRLIGYSSNPALEVPLDDCDPARLAAVVSAIFP